MTHSHDDHFRSWSDAKIPKKKIEPLRYETLIPEKERTFLFPAVRIFTLRRSSRRMRTKTLTITTTTTTMTTRKKICTNGKESMKKKRTYTYAYTCVRTCTHTWVHMPHGRVTSSEWARGFVDPRGGVRTMNERVNEYNLCQLPLPSFPTSYPAGAPLSSIRFIPTREPLPLAAPSPLRTVALYIFLPGLSAVAPYDAAFARNTVYYIDPSAKWEIAWLPFAPNAVRENASPRL